MTVAFRRTAVAVSVIMVVVLLRPLVAQVITASPQASATRLRLARAVVPEDAGYAMRLALVDYVTHDREALERAVTYLRKALAKNPAEGRAWLLLARSYEDLGLSPPATYAFKRAGLLERSDKGVQWETGVLLLTQGQTKDAVPFFRQYVALNPSARPEIYGLFFAMGFPPAYILDTLVANEYGEYRAYLDFLMAHRLLSEAEAVWQRMGSWDRSRTDYLTYVDFLINANKIDQALTVWGEYRRSFGLLGDPDSVASLIWNGSFELPVQDGGFDWRLGKADGTDVFIDQDVRRSGRASLSAQFDGTSNPEVYLASQIVPVTGGGQYLLMARVSTEALTTRNGIILEVAGQGCRGLAKKTEPVTGSTPWKDLELDFTVPPECKAIKVGIKRERSDRFDNKISGDVWVDSVTLYPQSSTSQTLGS